MNANELADAMDTHGFRYHHVKKAVVLLRQQQERITQLEKLLEHYVGADCREMRYIQEIENKEAEIEALKLQLHTTLTNRDLRTYDGKLDMNNEPVAWMDKRTNKCVVFINTPPSDDWIPLYTHPAKTKHLSLQKVDGELVAVTYTDDEYRIIEVLWEKPPAKTLTDEEIEIECRKHGI